MRKLLLTLTLLMLTTGCSSDYWHGVFTRLSDSVTEPAVPPPVTTTTSPRYVTQGNATASATVSSSTTSVPAAAIGNSPLSWDPQTACNAAIAAVDYPQPPNITVVCAPGQGSMTDGSTIWLDPGQVDAFDGDGTAAETYAHELGHTWDAYALTDAERQEWANARGYAAMGWESSEDFADAFACMLGYCSMSYGGSIPTTEQIELLQRLLN